LLARKRELNQLLKELKPAFQEPKVMKYLQHAGIRKRFGFGSARVYFGQLPFIEI
jgi:hypothetical protein